MVRHMSFVPAAARSTRYESCVERDFLSFLDHNFLGVLLSLARLFFFFFRGNYMGALEENVELASKGPEQCGF